MHLALFVGSGDDLKNASEDASLGQDVDVEIGANEEEDDGEDHERGGEAEAQDPADGVLNVDDQGEDDDHDDGEGHVVPVEEAVDPSPPLLGRGVELVDAEGDAARPDAAGADGEEAEGQRENAELGFGRTGALVGLYLAWGRTQLGQPCYYGHHHHALFTCTSTSAS